jgi:hypothetical protein
VSGGVEWSPLERLVRVATAAGQRVEVDEFMAMGPVELPDGSTVHRYKHSDTRRYLNVDDAGHTYRYLPATGGHEPWVSPAPAVAHATGRGVIYVCWTNLDGGRLRPYRPGDRLVRGWTGVLDQLDPAPKLDTLAEIVFVRHNRNDRPDGRLCPSMSVGDVVMFGEAALSVDRIGFAAVNVASADLITDRGWRQAVTAPSAARTILDGWSQEPSRASVVGPQPELGR